MMLPETRSGLQISLDPDRIEISPPDASSPGREEEGFPLIVFLLIIGSFGVALLLAAYANRQIKKGKKGWV